MLTLFNLMIYLAGFGLTDLFMNEFKVSVRMKIIIYLVIGIIGYYNYKIINKDINKNISNNIYGENKKYS